MTLTSHDLHITYPLELSQGCLLHHWIRNNTNVHGERNGLRDCYIVFIYWVRLFLLKGMQAAHASSLGGLGMGSLRQEDYKFKANLGYLERPSEMWGGEHYNSCLYWHELVSPGHSSPTGHSVKYRGQITHWTQGDAFLIPMARYWTKAVKQRGHFCCLFFFLSSVYWSSGWPQILYVAETDPDWLLFPLPPECRDYKHVPPRWA